MSPANEKGPRQVQSAESKYSPIHQRETVILPGIILDAKCVGVLGAASSKILVNKLGIIHIVG